MKFYLSSYKIGDQAERLRGMLTPTKRVLGYIPNALDYEDVDSVKKEHSFQDAVIGFQALGIRLELLDLQQYFAKTEELEKKLEHLGGLWVRGGNVFVLRQAMKLSGLDELLVKLQANNNFVYGGYSAAGCVLSPTLQCYQIVDDATQLPYPQQHHVIWEGLGLIGYAFLPHYESNHPESSAIGEEVQYCQEHQISYKTLRDGDVIIIE